MAHTSSPAPAGAHVDIVANNPLACSQKLLARAAVGSQGKGLEVEMASSDASPRSQNDMRSYLLSRTSIDPESAPQDFLGALSEAIDATYVFASTPHLQADCPFADSIQI
jgi:hypothetical protein